MYKKLFDTLSLLNLLGQGLYTLALPIGIGALISYLVTEFLGAPDWIWAILLTLGTLTGLFSMVRFIITYSKGMERTKEEIKKDSAAREEKERRQAALREAAKSREDNNDD